MHFKSLKVFCDVVDCRSFSRAADRNGLTQSGTSQIVHQLEERLSVKLIDRSTRPFELTPEGQVYYSGCREIVDRFDALEDEVRTLRDAVVGRVRIASIYSVGLSYMNVLVQRFRERHPDAKVYLDYQHPDTVMDQVLNDRADLGLVSFANSTRTLQAVPWREERMTLVCAPNHELATRSSCKLGDLDGRKMIGFDENLVIRQRTDRLLAKHHVSVQMVMAFDNIETIKRAIEINTGVGLLPQPTTMNEVAQGTLVELTLEDVDFVRPIGIIHRRGKELSSTLRRFMELLQSTADSSHPSRHHDDMHTDGMIGGTGNSDTADSATTKSP
ncbi:MAG: LysR family transcriptional regulator [Pirellulaceae bacterium]|jgi:DNA-binding transcriptional LysR family regulator|nr:LysR family transcriptional regulator [Planctomycetaceae bacterium]HIM29786.1 LysR family transcriptional regulator [Planctomycetota bacterium]